MFTRPNVIVDQGAGWVGTSSPGGPMITADSNGVLHATWMDNRTGSDRGIYYAQSLNGGAFWTNEKRIDGFIGTNNYAPSIAADKSGGPFAGNLYIAWQYNAASMADIYVIRSTDGGITWKDRTRIDGAPANIASTIPEVAVDTDGRVYVAFQDQRTGNFDVYVARSDDGGAIWFPDIKVSTSGNNDAYPSLAAFGGTINVAWQESSASGVNLWIAVSTDRGNTWQIHNVISIPIGNGDARSISIAIDPANTIHAGWLMQDATGNSFIVYSHSMDGGNSWSSMMQINDVFPSITYFPNALSILYSSNIVYAVWSDNRNGDNDIYASWSEDDGQTWGDGMFNNNDLRVDDTDDNGVGTDDSTDQLAPSAAPGPMGLYVVWSDKRDKVAYHAYFASYEVSELLITEFRDGPDGQEQVELYNHGGRNIDMTGWGLVLDGVRVDLTPIGSIPPLSHVTVGDPASSTLVVDIALGDEGGSVRLLDQFSAEKDSVYYGQLGKIPDPVSSESVARVRIGGVYSSAWSRSQVPTFGSINGGTLPVSNPMLVLNEVLFNAANPNDRFVELYFKDRGSINIQNYVLVGDAVHALPLIVLTEANPFYVIRPVQAPGLFNLLDTDGDNLYLYSPGGALMDMVGWSTLHTQDMSMVRIPDGFGASDGYDDVTSALAGWQFNVIPSLPLVLIGPRQSSGGDLGNRIFYVLLVTNKEPTDAYVNIEARAGSQGWPMTLYQADGVTPLADSPGDPDGFPDVGLLPPEGSIAIQVAVDIPSVPQVQDWEFSTVVATVASDPLASASVQLTTSIYPYESPSSSANPTTIWIDSSPPSYQPKESQLTLRVTGRGTALFRPRSQDTVMMIDSSGSMSQNDPLGLRLEAAKHYVDLLSMPDRAAVIDFDYTAVLVNNDHLSSNYARIKSNIDTIGVGGGTDLLRPIRAATDEILNYGNQSHLWVEILLTDGDDTNGNTPAQILAEAQRAANNGIVIFTIGLIGSGVVNEVLLQDIANLTGGIYMRAQTASDLDAVYQAIGKIVKNLAGYDNDVTDDIPMINVFLPSYVNYVPGTVNPVPDYVGQIGGKTNFQWNVSRLNINETWTATMSITSSVNGTGLDATSYPDSVVSYIRYDDTRVTVPFPEVLIDVLAPPPPPPVPVNYTITRSPLMGDIIVDSVSYPAPMTFSWLPGEVHVISAPAIDLVAQGERWVFDTWDDGGAIVHNITVGNNDATVTAYYSHQFQPLVDLRGLDGVHSVTSYYRARGQSLTKGGSHGIWSEWVDEGSAISFDTFGAGSDQDRRWITLEDFGTVPWTYVDSAFTRIVVYWRQVSPSVVLQGLPSARQVPIQFRQFSNALSSNSWNSWRDWVDYNTPLKVGGRITIPPAERYVNLVSKDLDMLEWSITDATTYTVPFLHQFRPQVFLVGTDKDHTVDVMYVDNSKSQAIRVESELDVSWSGWADEGSNVMFSNRTTGDPPYFALNETTLIVDSAFVSYIVYAPPPPPNVEPNLKPLISVFFVIALVSLGLFWGNRKPWDRFVPPPKQKMTPSEMTARERKFKKMPMAEKLKLFSLLELEDKFMHDRRWTMSMLAFPFAAVEGLIGVASFATGLLRVPEAGNWFSIGLIVNSVILVVGIAFDLLMQRHGYSVPKEEELSELKSRKAGIEPEETGEEEDSSTASESSSSDDESE